MRRTEAIEIEELTPDLVCNTDPAAEVIERLDREAKLCKMEPLDAEIARLLLDGMSVINISKKLNISHQAVYKRIKKAANCSK